MTDRTTKVPGSDATGFATKDLLSADTSMDAVTLHVADLDLMTRYYRDALSLAVLAPSDALLAAIPGAGTGSRDETVVLGRGATPLVVLRRGTDLPRARRGEAGLFHTALLFDDAPALAAAVASVARTAPSTFVGSGDHLVSEAFYFTDPEGNGVELYHDRPRETWSWQDGQVAMDTLYIDPNAFLQGTSPTRRSTGRCRPTSSAPTTPWWDTCTSRSATSPRLASSTSTPWASRPRPRCPARCSSRRAGTTTTWP